MSLLADLRALLARYDDDAWVALANRGLLRRAHKDLGALDVGVSAETADAVQVAVGDRLVTFGAAGPAEARCTCPSPVVCQHVIAAGLWLGAAQATDTASSDPSTHRPVADTLHDELMAIDVASLTAHAGLPGLRWAHTYLNDLDQPPALERSHYLAVHLTGPEVVARYLGGGLDGVVLDQRVGNAARYQVAAVLAWQRAHGLELTPPAPRTRATAPTEAGLSRDESRARLLESTGRLLGDCVRVGVSHLSPAVHERLATAAVWAQGAEYHRLAMLLRRLADQVDLQLVRSSVADDLRLLDELVVAHALVAALAAAAATGESRPGLVGRARGTYEPVRSLDLVGLGGRPWRTGSGYNGLTCLFWAPARGAFLTWTDTRPESLVGFDPRARWAQPAPWSGLAAPATSAGRLLSLTAAQVSGDGRISGVESTSARVTPVESDLLLERLPVTRHWSDLAAEPRSLLAVADPNAAWAVLEPAAFLPPTFDHARQALVWPAVDLDGELLACEVSWSRLHAHAVGRIETLPTPTEGTRLVARVSRRHGSLVGEPLSLVRPGLALNGVDSLHFDGQPDRSPLVSALLASGVSDRVGGGAGDRVGDDDVGRPLTAVLPTALVDLRALLEGLAQRGVEGVPPGVVHGDVGAAHRELRATGWPLFTEPDAGVAPAEVLLRSHYVVQQVERLLA